MIAGKLAAIINKSSPTSIFQQFDRSADRSFRFAGQNIWRIENEFSRKQCKVCAVIVESWNAVILQTKFQF